MKRLKVGVFGAGCGGDLALEFMRLGCDVVALCDEIAERRESLGIKRLGNSVAEYSDFDSFIEHKMDIVILGNNFHEHAPYAIKCFERGIHVYCECISNGTMAEGVELIRAFEKSSSIFFLAENYPHMLFNREIKRVCDGGTLGKLLYAEGEYNHPGNANNASFAKRFNFHEKHWRNYLPRTYYITHSLGPIMWATGATSKRVTAFAVFEPLPEDTPSATQNGDRAAIVMTQNDDGSVFKVTGHAAFGAHWNSYRVCGINGQIENLRGIGGDKVMLRYNEWSEPTLPCCSHTDYKASDSRLKLYRKKIEG